MKTNKTYYFSVEGGTEVWYLDWLEEQINKVENRIFKTKFNAKKYQSPISKVKNLKSKNGAIITHLVDVEGDTKKDFNKFESILDRMEQAEGLGDKVIYNLAYSTISFEL